MYQPTTRMPGCLVGDDRVGAFPEAFAAAGRSGSRQHSSVAAIATTNKMLYRTYLLKQQLREANR
jgi:hypothetical protein